MDIWIKSVTIKNFQSHNGKEPTYIPFIKGTNGLLGTSNSGKTSTIRAIKWCLLNTPTGSDFVSVGTPKKEAMVKVELSNGYTVERRRKDGGINLYRLHKDDVLVEEYTGFGNSVPQEILDAHGMEPITDKVYSQFHDQLEGSFMLSLKPRKRAEVLGDLDELKRVDKALTSINDDVRFYTRQQKENNETVNRLKGQEAELQTEIERMHEKVARLKLLKETIESVTELTRTLRTKRDRLQQNQRDSHTLSEAVQKSGRVIALYPEELESLITQFESLSKLNTQMYENNEALEKIEYIDQSVLDQLKEKQQVIEPKIKLLQLLKPKKDRLVKVLKEEAAISHGHSDVVANYDLSTLEALIEQFKKLSSLNTSLEEFEADIVQTTDAIESAEKKVDTLFDQFLTSLKEEGICPTCGRETDDLEKHQLEHVN